MWSSAGTVLTSVIGSSVISACITSWMNRSTSTTVETLKAHFEHGRIVTKAQLDIELTGYKDVWSRVAEFLTAARSFINVPHLSTKIPSVSEEDELSLRLRWYTDAFRAMGEPNNALVISVRNHRPFLSYEVADAVLFFGTSASNFYTDSMTEKGGPVLSPEWEKERRQWLESLTSQSERIVALIRNRLENLQVLGRDWL